MKKILALTLAVMMIFCCAACGGSASGGDTVEGDVSSLLETITTDLTDPELALGTNEVTADNFEWYFFIPTIDGAEAMVSEPLMGSIAHTIALVRLPEGVDAEETRAEIEANVNPHKWICVEAEKTSVVARGDLILLAMGETAIVDEAVERFHQL